MGPSSLLGRLTDLESMDGGQEVRNNQRGQGSRDGCLMIVRKKRRCLRGTEEVRLYSLLLRLG